MATRAIITIKGEPFIAIHWDGDPWSLGRDLVENKAQDKYQIIRIAEKHDIDFIEKEYLEGLNEKRKKVIAKRNNLTIKEVENGVRPVVQSNLDSVIGDIKDYEDWCEYQYNFNSKKWEFAEYPGKWSGTKEEFKDLENYLVDEGILKKEKECLTAAKAKIIDLIGLVENSEYTEDFIIQELESILTDIKEAGRD
jgi:hypothetical protein